MLRLADVDRGFVGYAVITRPTQDITGVVKLASNLVEAAFHVRGARCVVQRRMPGGPWCAVDQGTVRKARP